MPGDHASPSLTPAQRATLDAYARLIAGWRGGNVAGLRDAADVRRVLIGDALSLLELAEIAREESSGRTAGRWADLGSGAGIPGIPVAIVREDVSLALIEATATKCAFLREAVKLTGLADRAEVVCARSEEYAAAGAPGREAFALVLARAVGPLPTVVELAAPLLAGDGLLLVGTSGEKASAAHRDTDIVAARCGLAVEAVRTLTCSPLDDSVCVLVRKVAPTPMWLPRRPGRARSRPLSDVRGAAREHFPD